MAPASFAMAFAESSYPLGVATRTRAPSIAAAWASDVATLFPSPTKAIVRPRRDPQRSINVRQSASAWQGCSSSVSALMTRSAGAASAKASRRDWGKSSDDCRVHHPAYVSSDVGDRITPADRPCSFVR